MSTLNVDTIQDKGAAFEHARLVQVVNSISFAKASGTTQIPNDDTIPTSSEGTALAALDTAITPTNAANTLIVMVNFPFLECSGAANLQVALYQDSGSAAIAATTAESAGGTAGLCVQLNYIKEGSIGTSSTTFKTRYGAASSVTNTVNGYNDARKLGGVAPASMTIMEIRA